MFRILNQEKNNFLDKLSINDYKIFRKRSISLILATDMAKHADDLKAFNALLNTNEVSDGENV